MANDQEIREATSKDLDKAREYAKGLTTGDFTQGAWLEKFLHSTLKDHAAAANAAYFAAEYPGLAPQETAAVRIMDAKRNASIAGWMATSVDPGSISSVLSEGPATAAKPIPAHVVSFAADMLYMTRVELELAHDIAVLYGKPFKLDDPFSVADLVRLAFGPKAGKAHVMGAFGIMPALASKGLDRSIKGAGEALQKGLPDVGKLLVKRNLVKFSIPQVKVSLGAALDYYYVGSIAATANSVLLDWGAFGDDALPIDTASASSPRVLVDAMWLVMRADEKVTAEELKLLDGLTTSLMDVEGGEEVLEILKGVSDVNAADVIARVSRERSEMKAIIYQAVCEAAVIDRDLHRKERKVVEQFAQACGVKFDEKELKERAKTRR